MKKVLPTRECEIKYEIFSDQERSELVKLVEGLGFRFIKKQLEADFIPDVKDFLCRENGLLLRLRGIFGEQNDILLTLKIKRKVEDDNIKDSDELQYLLSEPNLNIFNEINKILKEFVGKTLPPEIHQFSDFYKLKEFIVDSGFDQHRIFLEKERAIYQNGGVIVTFDQLPENLGCYLEIEAQNPQSLREIIDKFGLPKNRITAKDYGDIMKEKKSGLPEIERRTSVFSGRR